MQRIWVHLRNIQNEGTREREYEVRLIKADIDGGNMDSAEKKKIDEYIGLARHNTECTSGIDGEDSKVQEKSKTQHKGRYQKGQRP